MDRLEEIVDDPDGWVAQHIREYVETDGRRGHRLPGRLWKLMTSIGPSPDDFQRTSGREIPIVILERMWR